MLSKLCTKCNQAKPLESFHTDRTKRDSKGSCCKQCTKSRQQAMAEANKVTVDNKVCTKCLLNFPSNYFGKDKYTVDGLMCQCKSCEKVWRINNPDNIRNSTLNREYGIDLVTYRKMLASQDGACLLCTLIRPLKGNQKSLGVDHCHITGRVRGLLCYQHNTALGKLGDSVESIETVLLYLRGKL